MFLKKKNKIENCGRTSKRFSTIENELKHVLNTCLMPQYRLIKIEQEIGEGSYGKVYKVFIKGKNTYLKVAVKYLGKNTKNQMIEEFNNSLQMDKNNLGPKIYKVFLYKNYLNVYKGVIVMEYMSLDALNALDSKLSVKQKKLIIYEMLVLIHKSAKIAIKNKGKFCFDIKLMNFVVNIRKGVVTKVRMIDFDSDWCIPELKSIKNLRKYAKKSKNPLVRSISQEKEVFLILLLTMIGSLALFWEILDVISKSARRKIENKAVLGAILPHIQTLCRDPRLRMGISIILQKEINILNQIMNYSVKFQFKDLAQPSKSRHYARVKKYLPNWRKLSMKERIRDIIEIIIGNLCDWGRRHDTFV